MGTMMKGKEGIHDKILSGHVSAVSITYQKFTINTKKEKTNGVFISL
jgi:hypothetical protein